MKNLFFILLGSLIIGQMAFAKTETFKLYPTAHAQVTPDCDHYTELKFDNHTTSGKVTLTNKLAGSCDMMVVPNLRVVNVTLKEISKPCGIKHYVQASGSSLKLDLYDYRGITCRLMPPAKISVSQYVDNGQEYRLYSNN